MMWLIPNQPKVEVQSHITTVRDDASPQYAFCTCGWTAVGRLARARAWAHRVGASL